MKFATSYLAPMIIASGLAVDAISTDVISEKEENNINLKECIKEHLNTIAETNYSDLVYRIRFKKAYQQWKEETLFCSSPTRIIQNQNFQKILSMKEAAVPFIVEELEREPGVLVWALNLIYDKKISNSSTTTIASASKMWIKFLSQSR